MVACIGVAAMLTGYLLGKGRTACGMRARVWGSVMRMSCDGGGMNKNKNILVI
ncbi:hypothetical protein GXY_14482 [Novacetimonas hansenii ATCC 23769]|uniref:Uncharacterized protein n=1 Tax=Novacetimonas hansenii ATCC 23769 TaxID=714995 RepID=D5QIB5_NOVHA|nr:hypothetical protein GXY_14482 [Novacetimonas hansenii ATCC 23769]